MDALKVIYDQFGDGVWRAICAIWPQVNGRTELLPMDLVPVLNEINEPSGKYRIPREINFDFHGVRGTVHVKRLAIRNMGEDKTLFFAYVPAADRLYWHQIIYTTDSGEIGE